MKTRQKLFAGLAGGLIVLAACDGSDGFAANPQSQFGAAFLAAFNAEPNSIPVEPGDIIFRGKVGPTLTGTPLDI
jgi:hypothetical protein